MGPKKLVAIALAVLITSAVILIACGTGGGSTSGTAARDVQGSVKGVLKWKASYTGNGLYSSETILTPQNVNRSQFGEVARFNSDGVIMAQPLYVSDLDMGGLGTHNVILVVSERDEVLAFDADGKSTSPLWRRSYLEPGVTPAPDNFGGRTNIGGEIGITGTPVIDTNSGAMYFVTTFVRNGQWEQWLRSIDIRTGKDFGKGSMKIVASVPGDGPGSVNGQIAFNPGIQNQRLGLALLNGNVLVGWGSFSDWGVYRGWLMAFDKQTLQLNAVFSPATERQDQDVAFGPADHGGGASLWAGGASPAIDDAGNIYVTASDGSFNADKGGKNYGDTLLKLTLTNGGFQVVDYFSPHNRDCINKADLEIGSGGFALLPSEVGGSRQLGMVITKEGRFYLIDRSNLGKWTSDDSQVPQQFMVGSHECFAGVGHDVAEGSDWQRLYGNPTYWNGSVYLAPSNTTLRQYKFSGSTLNPTPASQSPNVFWWRGANTVVSSNGNSNAIVWAYSKNRIGVAELRAFDATNVSRELWNNQSGALFAGTPFGVPVVVNGRVIIAGRNTIAVYGLK